jgi:hypothetical protein
MATKKKSVRKNPAEEKRELKRWSEQGKVFRAAESRLRDMEFTHQWAIAEWVLAGVKAFGKDKAYRAAIEATRMTEQTLDQFLHTARNVSVLTRVKGVSFGHHRLVAKFKGPDRAKRQKDELNYAKTKGLSVGKFRLHLRGVKTEDERQKNAPTNSDWCAKKFVERCAELVSHTLLQALMDGDPPEATRREEVVAKLKETATKLNEIVSELEHHWQLYLPLSWGVGFTRKEDYEEWKRRQATTKSAAAGGLQ